MKYRSEVDGLRAIAVLPVVFFHAGFDLFSGGFVGVDVFFVISGYLITSILLKNLEDGNFSLLTFYERRARRILPALTLVVLVCIPLAVVLMNPQQLKDFAQSVLAVGFFASNFLFWHESGYFQAASEEKPLLHTWSLAVEEQFYIFFPLLLWFVVSNRRQLLVPILMVLVLASLALSEWGWRNAPSATFFLAPARVWELLIGSICAIATRRGVVERDWLSVLGLAMITASVFLFDKETPFPSLYTLLPVVGTALVILFAGPRTTTGRMLGSPVLVGIGLISYSTYLWHQPLFAFARIRVYGEPSLLLIYCLIALSFALAYLSWRFVETPFRQSKGKAVLSQKAIFLSAGSVSMVFAVFGLWGHMADGWRTAYVARLSEPERRMFLLVEEVTQTHRQNALSRFDNGACVFDVRAMDPQAKDRITDCAERHGPGVLIFGDSHAIDLYGAVTETSKDTHPFIVGIVSGGCRPHAPASHCSYDAIARFVASNADVFKVAIYEQAGFYLLQGKDYEVGSRSMFAKLLPDQVTPPYVPNIGQVLAVRSYLEQISESVPVVWLSPRIEPHISQKYMLRAGCEHDYVLRPGLEDVFKGLETAISEALDTSTVMFMSQNELLDLSFPEDFLNCEVLLWSDGDHLSNAGERRFGQRMQILRNALLILESENK